jgi:hypothetical protein
MKAAKLIEELKALVAQHGDHEVTVVLGVHEYSVRHPAYNGKGALADCSNLQTNLPSRFVLTGKDNL